MWLSSRAKSSSSRTFLTLSAISLTRCLSRASSMWIDDTVYSIKTQMWPHGAVWALSDGDCAASRGGGGGAGKLNLKDTPLVSQFVYNSCERVIMPHPTATHHGQ